MAILTIQVWVETQYNHPFSIIRLPRSVNFVAQCFGHGAGGKATQEGGRGKAIAKVHVVLTIACAHRQCLKYFCSLTSVAKKLAFEAVISDL